MKGIARAIGSFLTNFILLAAFPAIFHEPVFEGYDPRTLFLLAAVYSFIYSLTIWSLLYRKNFEYYLLNSYRTHIQSLTTALVLTAALVYPAILFGLVPGVSPLAAGLPFVINSLIFVALVAITFLGKRLWIHYLCELGYFRKNVLFLADGPDVVQAAHRRIQNLGYTKTLKGVAKQNGERWSYHDLSATEEFDTLEDIVYRNGIGEIVVLDGDDGLSTTVLEICRQNGISYYRMTTNRRQRYVIQDVFTTNRDSLLLISLKRVMDVVAAIVGLLLFLPFVLVATLFIKLEDRGPILYVSKRVGKDGQLIDFYKFRTMVIDAEKRKKELLKYNIRKDGPLFKMENDPRVTRIGAILRRFSIDEVPQFLNVLIGNMSIVGPRPHLPSEVEQYSTKDFYRLECMPGITCIPQVKGRNTLTFREWIDLDLEYRGKWTVWLDAYLVLMTALIVVKPLFIRSGGGH